MLYIVILVFEFAWLVRPMPSTCEERQGEQEPNPGAFLKSLNSRHLKTKGGRVVWVSDGQHPKTFTVKRLRDRCTSPPRTQAWKIPGANYKMLQGGLSRNDDVEQLQLGVTTRLSHRSSNLSSVSFKTKAWPHNQHIRHDQTCQANVDLEGGALFEYCLGIKDDVKLQLTLCLQDMSEHILESFMKAPQQKTAVAASPLQTSCGACRCLDESRAWIMPFQIHGIGRAKASHQPGMEGSWKRMVWFSHLCCLGQRSLKGKWKCWQNAKLFWTEVARDHQAPRQRADVHYQPLR